MRRKLVAGNWKMNGSLSMADMLISELLPSLVSHQTVQRIDVMLCPPAPYLYSLARQLAGSGVKVGGQTLSEHAAGAFTGEISAQMLCDVGASAVLVGHSERRALFGETNACVAEKFAAAQRQGLLPVLCVGETLQEREADRTWPVVQEQLDAVVSRCGEQAFAAAVIAYEPVWAIGTGVTATPAQAQAVHAQIRAYLRSLDAGSADGVVLLYGGSVKADNAAALFGCPDIDGGLIGGASLEAGQFLAICDAAAGYAD